MSRKKRESKFEFRPMHAVIGVAVVLVSAAITVGAMTWYFDGDPVDGSDGVEAPSPIGPEPALESSAAADILANKAWDEMTADERALVQAEVERVYANAAFRATTPGAAFLAIDVFRADGLTRVSRQFWEADAPGQAGIYEALTFYCPSARAGRVDAHRYDIAPLETVFSSGDAEAGMQPWQPILSGLDWSTASDLGFREIDGRRVHGFQVYYALSGEEAKRPVRHWFDVETALLRERESLSADNPNGTGISYHLDWRQLAPPSIPAGQEVPACVEEIRSRARAMTHHPSRSTAPSERSAEHDDTERLEAFSDGVFAIAITLLVLEIGVPEVHGGESLTNALLRLWPSYFGYVVSFLTIGVMWINHHHLFKDIDRVDHTLLVLNLLLLLGVAFLPFPTALVAEYLREDEYRLQATLAYGCTLTLLAALFNALWLYASSGRRLIDEHVSDARVRRRTLRYLPGTPLYALPMLFAFVSPFITLAWYAGLAAFYLLPQGE